MPEKILIYRTDRIGDLIVTCPSIISIKKHFEKPILTLIASDKNYEYAKKLNIFDFIRIYPKKGFLKKINFIINLRKNYYDYILVFDGKERSIISASLANSSQKVALTQKIKFYYRYLGIFFCKDKDDIDLQKSYQNMFNSLNINASISNYSFLQNKENNNFSSKIPIKEYVHIHLDEKWFSKLYIKNYEEIDPNYDEFADFLNTISEKKDVLITTGLLDLELTKQLKENFFENLGERIFYKKNFNNSIYLIDKPSFEDIESLLRNSKILISCHGSIIHAANSFDVVKIDIIEKNKITFYKKFISYLESHTILHRSEFKLLSKEIIKKLLIQS